MFNRRSLLAACGFAPLARLLPDSPNPLADIAREPEVQPEASVICYWFGWDDSRRCWRKMGCGQTIQGSNHTRIFECDFWTEEAIRARAYEWMGWCARKYSVAFEMQLSESRKFLTVTTHCHPRIV